MHDVPDALGLQIGAYAIVLAPLWGLQTPLSAFPVAFGCGYASCNDQDKAAVQTSVSQAETAAHDGHCLSYLRRFSSIHGHHVTCAAAMICM